jgi:hypothetical protein
MGKITIKYQYKYYKFNRKLAKSFPLFLYKSGDSSQIRKEKAQLRIINKTVLSSFVRFSSVAGSLIMNGFRNS